MLNLGWRPGLAVVAAFGVVALAAGARGPAGAAVRRGGREFATSAVADASGITSSGC